MEIPDERDEIESTCERRLSTADPDRVAETCNEAAVTYLLATDGTRRYACRDHAVEPLRFATEARDELRRMEWNELQRLASDRGVNVPDATRHKLIKRLASRHDLDDLDDHPRVRRCGGCGKWTLVYEWDHAEGRCIGCSDEDPRTELSVDRYL